MIWLWVGFLLFVAAVLAFDLGVLNRKAHRISTREALKWTAMYVSLSLTFSGLVYVMYENHWLGLGTEAAMNFPGVPAPAEGAEHGAPSKRIGIPTNGAEAMSLYLLGYVVEQSLSLDNMFVIAVIFAYFRVPAPYQHRLLFWGIMGAVVMRGAMILTGSLLLHYFEWVMYVFAALLAVSAIKMLRVNTEEVQLESNVMVRLTRRLIPVSPTYEGQRFFTRIDGRLAITPMMLALVLVETADVMFAFDSIPAIFAITRDPFLVFTSNVFAILGLRSLFFALAGMLDKFEHLKYSLIFVLLYIAAKMVLAQSGVYHVNPWVSLGVVVSALAAGVAVSVVKGGHKRNGPGESAAAGETREGEAEAKSA